MWVFFVLRKILIKLLFEDRIDTIYALTIEQHPHPNFYENKGAYKGMSWDCQTNQWSLFFLILIKGTSGWHHSKNVKRLHAVFGYVLNFEFFFERILCKKFPTQISKKHLTRCSNYVVDSSGYILIVELHLGSFWEIRIWSSFPYHTIFLEHFFEKFQTWKYPHFVERLENVEMML